MGQALDALASSHGLSHYDTNVAEELWAETPKEAGNKVYVRDYISTVVKG